MTGTGDDINNSCQIKLKMEEKDGQVNGNGMAMVRKDAAEACGVITSDDLGDPVFIKVETVDGKAVEVGYENCPDEDDVEEVGSDGDSEFYLPLLVKMEVGSCQQSLITSCFKEEPEVSINDGIDLVQDGVETDAVKDSSELIPSSPSELEAEYETGEVPNDSTSDSDKITSEPIFNGKMQQCPHCDYSSRKSFNVRSHIMAKHTKQKPHKCPYCNYRATQAGHLKVHIMYKHTNEKPHQCPQCDFRATRYEQVRCHVMAKHTNEKPYPCPYCEYRATESGTLKSHVMAKHTNEKPHKCPHCDYRTIRSSGIRKHILNKHTYEKPHPCPFCGYRARQFSQLRSHIVFKHTNGAPYQCPHCDYRATQSGHLRRHIFRKHRLASMQSGLLSVAGTHQAKIDHNA